MGAVGFGLKALGAIKGHRDAKKAARANQEQAMLRARNAVTTMNYNIMNLREQRRDMFASAVNELEKIKINSRGLQGGVQAAVAEDMGEGRTARALTRSTKALADRAAVNVKDNYQRQSNQVDINTQQELVQAQNYVDGIRMSKMPSNFGLLGNLSTAYLGYYNDRETVKAFRMKHGVNGSTPRNTSHTWGTLQNIKRWNSSPYTMEGLKLRGYKGGINGF